MDKKQLRAFIDTSPFYKEPSPREMGQWVVIECAKHVEKGYDQSIRFLYFKERAGSMVRVKVLT